MPCRMCTPNTKQAQIKQIKKRNLRRLIPHSTIREQPTRWEEVGLNERGNAIFKEVPQIKTADRSFLATKYSRQLLHLFISTPNQPKPLYNYL